MRSAFEIVIKIKVAQPWVDDGLSPRTIKQRLLGFLKDGLLGASAGRDLKIDLIDVREIEDSKEAKHDGRDHSIEIGVRNGTK